LLLIGGFLLPLVKQPAVELDGIDCAVKAHSELLIIRVGEHGHILLRRPATGSAQVRPHLWRGILDSHVYSKDAKFDPVNPTNALRTTVI
jgi:hypothetical protein